MARMSKEEQARREGMAYALRFAREKGLDALEADLKMRNAIDLPLRVSKADLDKFSDNVKYNTVLYVKILMAVTMHDEFGFGNKRIKQMFERFDNKAECIAEDYSTWEEQIRKSREVNRSTRLPRQSLIMETWHCRRKSTLMNTEAVRMLKSHCLE